MSTKQTNNKNANAVIGVPWYSERAWKKMKEISDDQESFHDNFQAWLQNADKSVVLLTNRGKAFTRLNIDPVSYSWWCEHQAIQRNKESRRAYIQYLLEAHLSQQDKQQD